MLASDFNMAENETHEIREYPGRKARSKLHQSHQKESSALLDILVIIISPKNVDLIIFLHKNMELYW